MSGIIISDAVTIARRLLQTNQKLKTKILTTKLTLDKIHKIIHSRFVGNIKIKGISNSLKIYEILDGSDELKMETSETFSYSMSLMNEGNYSDAIENFQRILKINPKDFTCEQMLSLCKILQEDDNLEKQYSLQQILQNSLLRSAFEKHLIQSMHDEYLKLWKQIEIFESALEQDQKKIALVCLFSKYFN